MNLGNFSVRDDPSAGHLNAHSSVSKLAADNFEQSKECRKMKAKVDVGPV